MRSWVLFTILTLSTSSFYGQDLDTDCLASMRKGVFSYESGGNEIEIIRTNKIHVEVYNQGASKLFLNVVWENDSTYVLTMDRGHNAEGCLDPGDIIRSTITRCSQQGYECAYTSDSCGEGRNTITKKID